MKITQQQLRQIIKEEAEAHFAEMHGKGKHHGKGAAHSNRFNLDRMRGMGEPDPELAYDEDAASMMSRLHDDPGFDPDFYTDQDYDIDDAQDMMDGEDHMMEEDETVELDLSGDSDAAVHEADAVEGDDMHEGEDEVAADEALNESRWSKLAGLNG